MLTSVPILKDLVLLGGGHSHVTVLKRFGMRPLPPGVRLTLVSRGVDTPYSGMLPGLIAGHYSYDDAHIDLRMLARFADARSIVDEATGLDLANRQVLFARRPPVSYDVLSIDIGSTPNVTVAGAAEHAIPVKPIDQFLARWMALSARVLETTSPTRIAVVGGGAGGVELLLAVQHHVATLRKSAGRDVAHLEYHLFTDSSELLPTHNRTVRRIFERILAERGVRLHAGSPVVEVLPSRLRTADGQSHQIDEVLWTTQAAAASWLAESGLAVDGVGFVQVSDTLRSSSHANVFASGDVASVAEYPRPKSGVFAVRHGRPLERNLRRALLGQPLASYRPQRQFLSLISTGDEYAVASRGPFAFEGAWLWRWKDWIDRRFMRRFSELPEMVSAAVPEVPTGLADAEALAALSATAMRCGGCGAKVGASVLTRALDRVPAQDRGSVLIGLDAPDDAAVVETPDGGAVVHTVDFFRSMLDDPYVFGQIAAHHTLSDVYAMGGDAESALAIVTVPHGPESKVEDTLTHVMAGAAIVLREAGAKLLGGHTSEGAELGLGFAVHGRVDPGRVLRKAGLQPGDRLILTKALGTGTLFAADMRHRARGRWIASAVASMLQSNRDAARALLAHSATACTDVTGFGLLGHLVEMLKASSVDAELELGTLPILDGAEQTVRAGILSSLQPQNVRLRRAIVNPPDAGADPRFALLFDPQTSGGLLAGVPAAEAESCVRDLRARGYAVSTIIGTVMPRSDRPEMVTLKK
ncbi:MAG: selenide, water dikinase SelD [Acidobacteria bacterium]|nr:selenide, water dikinase SelD [Acidobacteriota bacterium]